MRKALTYENFDVLLERTSGRTYRARVVDAPAGEAARVEFTLPFEPLELENFLLRIGQPRRVVRSVDAPETTAIKVFGGQLYHALFHDDVRVSLERSPQRNRRQRRGAAAVRHPGAGRVALGVPLRSGP